MEGPFLTTNLKGKKISKWICETFPKTKLKEFSDYFYKDLAKQNELIWFKEWFLKWYLSNQNSNQNIVVLKAIETRQWIKPDGTLVLSTHPPVETIWVTDTKHPGFFMEAVPFISSKDETLVSTNTKQQNFINLILQTQDG